MNRTTTAPRRRLILAICCSSLLIVSMDATIINVALPSISAELKAPISGLQWTIDAYVVTVASFLLLAGSAADRFGRRRTFQVGLVLFVAGSLACSLAPSLGWLVGFRMVQALGGSMLTPVAMSIITNVFTEPAERARAIGVWGGVAGLGLALGPLVGGVLIELAGWRSIFWINVPVGLLAMLTAWVFIPESRSPRPRRFDPVGQLAVVVALACTTYAIIEAPRVGWRSPITMGLFVLAAIALVALIAYESRRTDPLLEVRFFRSVPFAGATVVAVCAFGAFSGFLFLNTLYLQEVRGLSPLHAGLATLPLAIMVMTCGPISGHLVATRGPRPSLLIAGSMITLAGLALAWVDAATPLWWVLLAYAAFGIGHGVVNAPITTTTVSGMPRSHAGVAAAVATTSRQLGIVLGVAIVGAVLSSRISGPIATGFESAAPPAFGVVIGFGVAVLVIGWGVTTTRAKATTARVAHLFAEERRQSAGAGVE
jgi:EmrB/QacA subfamily drug resistance transporter